MCVIINHSHCRTTLPRKGGHFKWRQTCPKRRRRETHLRTLGLCYACTFIYSETTKLVKFYLLIDGIQS